jgi:hypothetical protein
MINLNYNPHPALLIPRFEYNTRPLVIPDLIGNPVLYGGWNSLDEVKVRPDRPLVPHFHQFPKGSAGGILSSLEGRNPFVIPDLIGKPAD